MIPTDTRKPLAKIEPVTCQLCGLGDHEWCSGVAIVRNQSRRVLCACALAGHPEVRREVLSA